MYINVRNKHEAQNLYTRVNILKRSHASAHNFFSLQHVKNIYNMQKVASI